MKRIERVSCLIAETEGTWQMLTWTLTDEPIEEFKKQLSKIFGADVNNSKTKTYHFSLEITKTLMRFLPLENIIHSERQTTIKSWERPLALKKKEIEWERIRLYYPIFNPGGSPRWKARTIEGLQGGVS